jgi:hypothetical protein
MKKTIFVLTIFIVCSTGQLLAQHAATYLTAEPPENKTMKHEETEFYTPVPPEVKGVANFETPPPDAIILFDGKNLDKWVSSVNSGAARWTVSNGVLTVKSHAGAIRTKQSFGDCQLHIEWRTPTPAKGEGQGRGNSGIFLQSQYELQVLDSYKAETYSNGQAGSIYKQYPPLANACLPPGQWQSYDIFYKAPVFHEDGSLESPASITVVQNGILVQNNAAIKGKTLYVGHPWYEAHGMLPLELQDHGNPVSYRNIWIREIK